MSTTAALALGSSIGDRQRTLHLATRALDAQPGLRVVHASRIHATPPVGGVARASFLNAVLRVETELAPLALLATCKHLEVRLGRRPSRSWADRVLDIDVLLFGADVIRTPTLHVPHPRLAERDFLLEALWECWPDAPNPWTRAPWAATLRSRRAYPIVGTLPR
jgi:2-amino-4-hydroxy-6-hydroxymethyldihydropteridine diphosphokinase